jgi:hypothetical protein
VATIQNANVYWEPDTPAARPIRGLFDVAEVYNVTDPHIMLGAEYLTNRCVPAGTWLGNCLGEPDFKTFNGLGLVEGAVFAVYDGIECNDPGLSPEAHAVVLQESFDVKAEAVVEAQLQAIIRNGTQPVNPIGTLGAIAGIEELLAQNYAGRGLIHMDRASSVFAYGQKGIEDPESHAARVQTINGTPVVLGRGYTRAANSVWVGGTGRVIVLRGPLKMTYSPSTGDSSPLALAEQQFVLLVECGTYWAEIPLT